VNIYTNGTHEVNANSTFINAAYDAGLIIKAVGRPGVVHRVGVVQKNGKGLDGSYKLFPDGSGGWFQNFVTMDAPDFWFETKEPTLTPEKRAARRAAMRREAEESARLRNEEHKQAAIRAERIFGKADFVDDDHPYLTRKGVLAHDIRVGDEGELIIPGRNVNGEIQTIQRIYEDGSKKFLAGGRKVGAMHIIGSIDPAGQIPIGEGYATCATIHEETDLPVVVAFDAGNMAAVAKELRAKYPDATIIICADDDEKGVDGARKAAKACGGVMVIPDFGVPAADREGRTDFNDLRQMKGYGAVAEAIGNACNKEARVMPTVNNKPCSMVQTMPDGVDDEGAGYDEEEDSSEDKQKATASARRAALKGHTHAQIVRALRKRHGAIPDLEAVADRAIIWADNHAPGKIVTLPSGAQREVTNMEMMNESYGLLNTGGQRTCVIHIPDSQPIPWEDFQNRVAAKVITGAVNDKGNVKLEDAGNFWKHDCRRRVFSKIAFTSQPVSHDTLNLFTEFGVKPTAGCCNKILKHVREVIASGDEKTYTALLNLWAWQLQNVGTPSRIILTLLSEKQQTGKGILFEQVLPKIWGLHGAVIKDKAHGLDRFNEFMRGKGLVVFDEAAFSGDKKLADRLKGESAATTSAIEGKNLPIITLPAAMNLVLLTNHRHCTHVEQGDMRFWMLEVSDKRRGDYEYFAALGDEIANGGVEAFAAFLLERDVSNFHPQRDVPRETTLWEENKVASLDPGDPMNWVLEALDTGGLPKLAFCEDGYTKPHSFDSGPQNVGGAELIAAYRSWCSALADRRANACGRNTFWRVLSDLGFASVKGAKGARTRQIPSEEELMTSLKAVAATPGN
jgi:hypothetical protein